MQIKNYTQTKFFHSKKNKLIKCKQLTANDLQLNEFKI
jgi:hypothetical protein